MNGQSICGCRVRECVGVYKVNEIILFEISFHIDAHKTPMQIVCQIKRASANVHRMDGNRGSDSGVVRACVRCEFKQKLIV